MQEGVFGGNPEATVGCLIRPGEARRQLEIIRCVVGEAVAIDVLIDESRIAADPDPLLIVDDHAEIRHAHGRIRRHRQMMIFTVRAQIAEPLALVKQPQAALPIHAHRVDEDLRNIERARPELERAVGFATADVAARITDPQSAGGIPVQGADGIVEQTGSAGAIEHDKLPTVVSDHAFPGTEPQVVVG